MPNSIVASASGRVPGPYKPLEIFNSACFNNPPTDQALPDMIEEFRHESQSDAWTFAQWLLMLLQDKELPSDDVSFSHMFEITSEERWTCEDCGETSILQLSEEIGMPRDGTGLSLGIAAGPSTTLVECLENKFESTWRRRCYSEHCSKWNVKEYDGPKRHITRKLTKTPEVLVLQVKRFDWGPRGPKKLFNKVQVEEYLNLGPFTKDRDDVMYRLDGVVAHKGGSISSGHYIAAVRNAEGTGFVRANDDTQVGTSTGGRGSVLEMQNPRSWHSDFQPYVLTYSKV